MLKLTSLFTFILKVLRIGNENESTCSIWLEFNKSSDKSNCFCKFGNFEILFEPKFKYSKEGKNENSEEEIWFLQRLSHFSFGRES